jgi:hypothetical protein
MIVDDTIEVINTIEEFLSCNDPYNQIVLDSSYKPTLRDCEFPDHITNPLLLLRIELGDEAAEYLEYEDDLERIAQALRECVESYLKKGHPSGQKSAHSQEIP